MNYPWLDEYCCSKAGAVKDFQEDWEVDRFTVGGKMFAMVGADKSGFRAIVTLKLEPERGQLLRETHPDIIPGYYMNKDHWNSVHLDGAVPDDVLREMVDISHGLVLRSLSKKLQAEIENSN